ncbi:MAG: hypothetical protein GY828_05760, partial [Candidatus Gracilibacteria bacterium]|nr:hypothetical protein [Candidatus Gracilibacteria bacterium]
MTVLKNYLNNDESLVDRNINQDNKINSFQEEINTSINDMLNGNVRIQQCRMDCLYTSMKHLSKSEQIVFQKMYDLVDSGNLAEAFIEKEQRDLYEKVYNFHINTPVELPSQAKNFLNNDSCKKLFDLLKSDLIAEFESILFDGCLSDAELSEYIISTNEFKEYQELEKIFIQSFQYNVNKKVKNNIQSLKKKPTVQRKNNIIIMANTILDLLGTNRALNTNQLLGMMDTAYKLSVSKHIEEHFSEKEKDKLFHLQDHFYQYVITNNPNQTAFIVFQQYFYDRVVGNKIHSIGNTVDIGCSINYSVDIDDLRQLVVKEGSQKNSVRSTVELDGIYIDIFPTDAEDQSGKSKFISQVTVTIPDSKIIENIKLHNTVLSGKSTNLETEKYISLVQEYRTMKILSTEEASNPTYHQIQVSISADGSLCAPDYRTRFSDFFEDIGEFEKLILTLVKRNFEQQTEILPSAFDEISEKEIIEGLEDIDNLRKKDATSQEEEEIIDEILTSEDVLADNTVHEVEEKEEVSAEEQEEIAAVRRRIKQEKLEAFARIKASPVKAIFNAFV